MHIIGRIAKTTAQEAWAITDRVVLAWEQRQRSRQKLLTLQGREIALALPAGTRLQAGDLLSTRRQGIGIHDGDLLPSIAFLGVAAAV